MVLTKLEKEIWDLLEKTDHNGFINRADLKKVNNKKELLKTLKKKGYVGLQYRIRHKTPLFFAGTHPDYEDPAYEIAYKIYENKGYSINLTWTGKWE